MPGRVGVGENGGARRRAAALVGALVWALSAGGGVLAGAAPPAGQAAQPSAAPPRSAGAPPAQPKAVRGAEPLALTLQQAVDLALKQSPTILQAQNALEGARLDHEQAVAEQLVRTSALTALQAETNWQIAQKNFELARVDLATAVESAYYDVLRAQQALSLAQANLDQAKKQLEATRTRFRVGMVAQADLLAGEAQVANAQVSVSQADSNLLIARMKLNNTLGLELDREVRLTEDFSYEPLSLNLAEDLNNALAHRVEIEKAQAAVRLAEKGVEVNDNDYTPDIARRQARLDLADARLALAAQRNSIVLEVQQAFQAVQTAAARQSVQKTLIDQAEQNLRAAQLRYNAGAITDIELASAQTALYKAQSDALQAVFDYNVALSKYWRAVARSRAGQPAAR